MSEKANDSVIANPEVKLEEIRDNINGNACNGRGQMTAASRGYNAERLASGVLHKDRHICLIPTESYYDSFATGRREQTYRVEAKSCVDQYPSGGYGRFRFWRRNHEELMEVADDWHASSTTFLYFFVVYTVQDGIEKEVGKLTAPLEAVDSVLDSWSLRDHDSMGQAIAVPRLARSSSG